MSTARDRAAALLAEVLADGPRVAGVVERAGTAAGLSVRTLRRAADEIGVIRPRDGARVLWSLPTPDPAGAGTHTAPGTAPDDTEEIETMTETTERAPLALLALADGLTVGGHVMVRGDRVLLDADAIDDTCDRHGRSWTDDLSAQAQMQRWGDVMVSVLDPAELDAPTTEDRAEAPAQRRAPIRPDPIGAAVGPGNYRLRPPGSTPILAGMGGDGPVRVVADRRDG